MSPESTDMEEQRVINGIPVSNPTDLQAVNAQLLADNKSGAEIAAVDQVLQYGPGNGLEVATAAILGEPVRTNHFGEFKMVADPTVHH